jgi:hypothetical protein
MSSRKRGRRRIGTVYLLHFSRPYCHARHYLGFSTRLQKRIKEHLDGRGSPLVRAVVEAGIEVFVARTWKGVTWTFEKRGHGSHRRGSCPICRGPRAYRWGRPRPDEMAP